MIKNIVFDMGRVLIHYDAKNYVKKHVKDSVSIELLYHEIFCSVEWLKMDRGVMTVDEAIASIQKGVPESHHSTVQLLIQNWHSDIPPFPQMEDLIANLKTHGYRIYLLSNTSKSFHGFRLGIPALKYFDGEFISADYGLLKPDFAIYEKFYKTFDLKPEECYFIDDSPANIEVAERTGMKGFVYHGDIIQLKKALIEVGISIG